MAHKVLGECVTVVLTVPHFDIFFDPLLKSNMATCNLHVLVLYSVNIGRKLLMTSSMPRFCPPKDHKQKPIKLQITF